jgi:hypothetical protein
MLVAESGTCPTVQSVDRAVTVLEILASAARPA